MEKGPIPFIHVSVVRNKGEVQWGDTEDAYNCES